MKCAEALERILEAELDELLSEESSTLADHLVSCQRCGEIARRIVASEEALASDLVSATPKPDLDSLLERARLEEPDSMAHRWRVWKGGLPGGTTNRTPGASRDRWTAKRWGRVALPLAAAAAAVTLLLPSTSSLPGDPQVAALTPPGLDLEVPEGRTAAVLETKDPNITVLWFF